MANCTSALLLTQPISTVCLQRLALDRPTDRWITQQCRWSHVDGMSARTCITNAAGTLPWQSGYDIFAIRLGYAEK